MARRGGEATPPVPPPAPLTPFLSFRRLTGRALERARRVLDEDDAFRARVRDAVSADDVGAAGWLLLDRPEGWEDRLGELVAEAGRQADDAHDVREAARLRRELAKVAAERDEAVGAAREAREDEERARAEVSAAEAAQAEATARADALGREVEDLRAERARAVRDLKAQELRATARLDELRRAHEDLAAARREVAALTDAGDDDPEGDDGAAAVEPTPEAPADELGAPGDAAAPERVDRDALAALVARAAEAAALLSSSLAEAAELVRPVDDGPTGESGAAATGDRATDAAPPAPGADPTDPAGPAARPARRQPVRLPVGVFDDGPEAARHLLRHPGTTLAVDGYNVSLAGWPTLALAAQRDRLVDGLQGLAARTGCAVVVVFDGADVGRGLPSGSRPRGVQVRFTAPGVEADDELLALLDALPPDRPVTIASSDRRVADGARRRGASVLSSAQLLAVLDG